MNHKQAANIIVNAYYELAEKLDPPKAELMKKYKKIEDVFNNLGPKNYDKLNKPQKAYVDGEVRKTLFQLLGIFMQPNNEDVYFEPSEAAIWADKNIEINTEFGVGLKIKNKHQIEIFQLVESEELNPVRFSRFLATTFKKKRLSYN